MPRKTWAILVATLFAALGLGIALSLFPPTDHLEQSDLELRMPIETPYDVLISCEVHQRTGETWYGGDAPIGALFAECKPGGDFYLVATPSTPEEACKTRNRPEVSFLLASSGDIKNIALTRSSGNQAVDRKVLQMVRDSRYPPTNCGACSVFARVPVDLKCPDRGH